MNTALSIFIPSPCNNCPDIVSCFSRFSESFTILTRIPPLLRVSWTKWSSSCGYYWVKAIVITIKVGILPQLGDNLRHLFVERRLQALDQHLLEAQIAPFGGIPSYWACLQKQGSPEGIPLKPITPVQLEIYHWVSPLNFDTANTIMVL